jgi:hypothetical protein
VSDPNADDDGDGQSNYAEFIAHTNPRDAASVLKIISSTCNADGYPTLTWLSVGGTRYRILVGDGLGQPFSEIIRDAAAEIDAAPIGQASTQSYTDTNSSPNTVRFYRVEVIP